MTDVLIISNCEPGDVTFESERGTWNVTRALRDCLAGKHKSYSFEIADVFDAISNIEVDQKKIEAMVADLDRLSQAPPVISILENGFAWMIDGHHRIHALHRLGFKKCLGYAIEETALAPYRIYWNGNPVAPWRRS